MIVLSATDISKAYGTDVILDRVSFIVEKGSRVGIVGANGAGKSTLMEILAGRSKPDSGNFFISQNTTVGYLAQNDTFEDDRTVIEEVEDIYRKFRDMEKEIRDLTEKITELSQDPDSGEEYARVMKRYGDLQERYEREGGFTYKSEMRGILNSMAFGEEYYDKPIRDLSGGERTRLALACLLMRKPDLLMLDEPTNHLDIGMLKWLEQFLGQYSGTILMVSHDRYFLDQLCTDIYEVEHHHLTCWRGNYTDFQEKKRARREADLRAYKKQQDEIRRQEDIIRRFKERGTEHLAKRAESREKRLAGMERIERPESEVGSVRMQFKQDFKSGNDVIFAEGLRKAFREDGRTRELFHNVNMDIKRGDRICIVGANGIGKTTLLRMILGETQPTEGYLKIGHNVEFGYYDQRQESLDPDNTVLEEVHDAFRLYKDSEIRGMLGRFLFQGDSVFTNVGSLSGGEKARLALLKLMMSGANVLLLDEPTNHLDIDSKEVFEDALQEYPGTILAVSHDRYFLRKIATKIFELTKDGIVSYEGGYDYYEEKRQEIASGKRYMNQFGKKSQEGADGLEKNSPTPFQSSAEEDVSSENAGKLSAQEERALKKKKEAEERRRARESEKLEERIMSLEEETEEIQKEMCRPEFMSNSKKLGELNRELTEKQKALEEAYAEWDKLS
ncbi:MAG: ABC-F family ATP-binding cassette domain-containing protein [Eubacteriales bacterium]|nr:ABC-F family ATP-binding cassette domain-containing protein [Eubacteriales bacterium]